MNVKTGAIILQKVSWKESSYIATLMTDKFGIIKAIVQGAKKPKSKFFSHFEIGNILELVLIKKDTTLSKITDSTLLSSYQQNDITLTYEQLLSLQITLETYSQLYITEDEADLFFDLLASFIDYLPSVKANHLLVNWRLMIRLSEYLGFPMVFIKNNKYELADPTEIKNIDIVQKWLGILPNTGELIKHENILDLSIHEMNMFVFEWFARHLQKKMKMNAVLLYEGLL